MSMKKFKTVEELLEDPARWIKATGAVTAEGKAVSVDHKDACAFCLVGALSKVYGHGYDLQLAKEKVRAAISRRLDDVRLPYSKIIYWNDDPATTHADVMEVVREAHV